MVLLAAAVTTRSGKPILSRQFIEMQKARIEGLLAAFPKLMSSGKQHTFVETESVRYVYQPLDQLYVLLLTTRTSNILEDLETLRLFSRLVPEYCDSLTEADVFDNAFSLILAFDEIVALGYRESVNLAQVRTFVEMDSHEERVYQAVRQTQEREAKQKMREKAKELQRQKYESHKRSSSAVSASAGAAIGGLSGGLTSPQRQDWLSSGGVVGASGVVSSGFASSSAGVAIGRPAGAASKALKLGKKSGDVDSFVDQLKSEGQQVAGAASANVGGDSSGGGHAVAPQSPPQGPEPVQLSFVERLSLSAHCSGGVQQLELHGQATLRCCNEQAAHIQLMFNCPSGWADRLQLQTHPQLDKQAFRCDNVLRLKSADKAFPVNTDVGILRWRLQSGGGVGESDGVVPLTLNCWPSEKSGGSSGCDVSIEYCLENKNLTLCNLTITVPVLRGTGEPVVSECEGQYRYDTRHAQLVWTVPLVDCDNASGTMLFSCGGRPADFFPVRVTFTCGQLMSGISISKVWRHNSTPTSADAGGDEGASENVPFGATASLVVDKFEVA